MGQNERFHGDAAKDPPLSQDALDKLALPAIGGEMSLRLPAVWENFSRMGNEFANAN